MIGKGTRITEGVADETLGNGVKGPYHVTIWRRTCAQAVPIEGDRITVQTADKTHVLVADSTGTTTAGKPQVDRDQVERKVQHQAAHPGR